MKTYLNTNHRLLRTETTDSQAALLRERLAQLDPTIAYQEEQHGPTLVVVIRFRPDHERAVRRILEDVGLAVRERDDQPDA